MPVGLKMAKDLAVGDTVALYSRGKPPVVATVLSVLPSVQTIQRKVVMVTVQDAKGRSFHRQFNEFSTVRTTSEGDLPT